MENVTESRLNATNRLISKFAGRDSDVIEIGSNDASFRNFHRTRSWRTVDKYGDPDIRADLDGPDATLPFADGSVDVVVCTEVLEHLRSGSSFVAEMSRILTPSGAAIISVPNICSLKSRVWTLFGRIPNMAASGDCGPPLGGTGILVDGHWIAGHVVDFNLALLRRYLRRGGLSVTRVQKVPIDVYVTAKGKILAAPAWMFPATLGDFLLVAAKRTREK